MRHQRFSSAIACRRGATAVEFALIFPLLVMLGIGGLYAGLVTFSAANLQYAVQQAARCYSVNVTSCASPALAQAYAQKQYYAMGVPVFNPSFAACGHQVTGSVTVVLNAVMASWTLPLTATACFP